MYKIYTTKPCWVDRHVPKILLIMKLITVLLIATMMQVSAASFAQKLTLKKDNISLEQLFKEIRKQTGYAVIYTAATIKDSKAINADFQNTPIEEVLTTSLKNQSLKFEIDTKNIIITKAPPTFLDRLANSWADHDIRGRVVDEKGNPLQGATVQLKGIGVYKSTNPKGEFDFRDVKIKDDAILVVSFIGYKQLEIAIKGAVMPLEIRLNQLTGELEEVKVIYNTGYQELDLKKSTGSVVQIDNELFNRQVGANVLERIYNITSGLIANPTASLDKNDLKIRGESTINANKQPLIIVDNFPYEGDLSNLNPNDVESITVLKDAAASAIWGVRAGNGVIVINMKKGKFNQTTHASIVSNLTITEKPDLFYIPYLSSKEMIDFERSQFSTGMYDVYDDLYPAFNYFPLLPQSIEILLAARKKNSTFPGYDAATDPNVLFQLQELGKYDVRNDIERYLLRSSINQQYAVNLNGGGDKYSYYTSVGYDRNLNTDIRDNNSRLTLNLNSVIKPIVPLEITTSLVHTRGKNERSYTTFSSMGAGIERSIYGRLADDDGNPLAVARSYRPGYLDTISFNGLLDWRYRPLAELDYTKGSGDQMDTRILTTLKYTIFDGLHGEVQYQNQKSQIRGKVYESQDAFSVRDAINSMIYRDLKGNLISPYPIGDRVTMNQTEFSAWNLRGTLNFNKSWKDHNLTALAGMEIRETLLESNSNILYGFNPNTNTHQPVSYIEAFPILRPSEGSTRIIGDFVTPQANITRHGSRYANAAYSYKNRYLFSASGRIDESNFFGLKANLRRTPLWSAGLGWNIHLEEFYKISFLSQFKLKASYGFTGNTNPGATSFATFQYLSEGSTLFVPRRNRGYAELLTPNNPGMSWEKVKIINFGLEFSLTGDRIQGNIEFYSKRGLDLLGQVSVEPTTGVSTYIGNYASMKSRGLDITFNTKNVIGKFQWTTALILSLNNDKVTALGIPDPLSPSTFVRNGSPKVGVPLSYLYSYRFAGLDPINGAPRVYLGDSVARYTDINKAKIEDLIYSGQKSPSLFGSIRNEFRYRSVTLSANIIYRFGHVFRRPSIEYSNLISTGWYAHSDYNLRWRTPGDELKTNVPSIPGAADYSRDDAYNLSNMTIEKADCIRLQDIRLGYNLTGNAIRGLPIRRATLYLYASNLWILWRANRNGIDPDVYSFGMVPQPKSLAFGINVNF